MINKKWITSNNGSRSNYRKYKLSGGFI